MIESFRALFAPPRDLIMLVAALWIGLALAEKRTDRRGISKDALNNLTFYSIFGYIIGGRVLYALANIPAFAKSPLNIFSINIDLFDPTSGLIAAIIVAIVYSRKRNLSRWGTLDAVTPLLAFLAIGLHLSHLAAGTAFGNPTALPWGIDLWNATRHPTQIYELAAALIIFGWVWFRNSDSPQGTLFLDFAALTAGSRLFLEAFRGDSALTFGEFRLAQVVAWMALAVALFVSESIHQRGKAI